MITRFARSVRGRLALFASATMVLLSILVNCYVLFALHQAAMDFQRTVVTSATIRISNLVQRDRLPGVLVSDQGPSIQVVDGSGRVVSSTEDVAGRPRLSTLHPGTDNPGLYTQVCDLPLFPAECRVLAALRIYRPGGDWLVYATEKAIPWYVDPRVPVFLIGLSAGLGVLTWFGVSRVVARTLAPVNRIRARLAEITATGGGMRVPVPSTDDEIRTLAETANRTLERLEAAVERQRRFASDASHDLRSPITAMRTQVEEALLYPEETDWPRTARALLASLDRLQAIVTDLLTLAKLDAGAPGGEEPVDLGEVAAAEAARPRSRKVVTTLQPGVVVTGDRLRLSRLITNLLDNAERHAESTIIITVRKDDRATLEVLDDGTGIAPEDREVVFQRFTRLDASRSRDAGGTGLGLPIAREIAHAHHGTLTIEDSDRGARFVLRLPLRSD